MSKLVMIRHGESMWNKKNVFTGWVDIPLSVTGINEAIEAGKEIANIKFDVIYVSTLIRAIETAMICMAFNNHDLVPMIHHKSRCEEDDKITSWAKVYNDEMEKETVPVYSSWHLNERYYGELQGKNKKKTAETYGDDMVQIWRRSFDIPPPNGESLKDTAERTIPYLKAEIMPMIEQGKNVLIVAHGNSLRSVVMNLNKLSAEEVVKLEIPTGKPMIYDL